jgi:ABC-2 type transport system permease protein
LSFRGNFLIKVTVEALWLAILLIFYQAVFARTSQVAQWDESQYFFYVGCYFAMLSVLESLFLSNCGDFAELIRTGDLDHYLLQPIDEQFLISCRTIEWSTVPSILMGVGVMILSLHAMSWEFDVGRLLAFLLLVICGVAIMYSFLLLLTSSSVWLTRNQSLYEIWWLFTSLMRYPKEVFFVGWAYPIGFFFTVVIPVLIAVNVPAETMVKAFDARFVIFNLVAAIILLWLSRRVFRAALKRYRSASS